MRRSGPRVAIGFRHEPESACLSALDDRRAVGEESVGGLDGTAERVGHDRGSPFATERQEKRVHRPLAAVGDGKLDNLLPAGAEPARQGGGDFRGRERPLEAVWSDEDGAWHRPSLGAGRARP